ncbi:MAG: F0F1 ATP synthase subunit A [Defluviitaleaceae bacterium]|nr:F0F1 ATP synthase subunit A [Defluviitaleaceae bacterium]
MNLDNRAFFTIDVFTDFLEGGIWITETHINTWIIMLIMIILALIIRRKLTKTDTPTGIQNVIELIVDMFDKFIISNLGEKNRKYGNWFFGVFTFLIFANFSGLIGLRPPTADITMTLALSMSTFFIIHIGGFMYNPKGYAKSFLEPFFVFLPMNIIGELAVPVSLGLRLFGNILSGMIILSIIYYIVPWFLAIGWPALLHAYFDVFAGLIQAFIFTVLSLTFISGKLIEKEA